jgi:hypothetical protein
MRDEEASAEARDVVRDVAQSVGDSREGEGAREGGWLGMCGDGRGGHSVALSRRHLGLTSVSEKPIAFSLFRSDPPEVTIRQTKLTTFRLATVIQTVIFRDLGLPP